MPTATIPGFGKLNLPAHGQQVLIKLRQHLGLHMHLRSAAADYFLFRGKRGGGGVRYSTQLARGAIGTRELKSESSQLHTKAKCK